MIARSSKHNLILHNNDTTLKIQKIFKKSFLLILILEFYLRNRYYYNHFVNFLKSDTKVSPVVLAVFTSEIWFVLIILRGEGSLL